MNGGREAGGRHDVSLLGSTQRLPRPWRPVDVPPSRRRSCVLMPPAVTCVPDAAHLLALGSFSAGFTLFHTFPKEPLDISSVMFTVAGSLLQSHDRRRKRTSRLNEQSHSLPPSRQQGKRTPGGVYGGNSLTGGTTPSETDHSLVMSLQGNLHDALFLYDNTVFLLGRD